MRSFTSWRLAWSFLLLGACDGGLTDSHPSSFDRIQTEILTPRCASCHTAGNAFANQSGLVLDEGVAYRNLVGVRPAHAGARADGLLRVMAGRSEMSLLFHKLHWDASHHHARDYGGPMPLGGEPLSLGQVEFIRRWIDAGAPRDGEVADVALLEDRTPQNVAPFTPLAPPERGYQLKIDRFGVKPSFERELFVYRRLANASELLVNRIETKMRPGSHHFLLYTFESSMPAALIPPADLIRDIRNPDGTPHFGNMLAMGHHVFFAGSMTQTSDYRFPEGVALRLPPNAALDLNSHYVNKTASEMAGEAYANLHTVDRSQVTHVATTLNLNNTSFSLPPRQRTTIRKTFLAGSQIPLGRDTTARVFMLTSHMHLRGERFLIRISGGSRDGEVVYDNTDWAHPVIRSYSTPIVLRRGEGLTSEITYNNTTDRTITFGLTSEDEMGIIFGYAY